jgi:hypothetical protein
MTTMLALLVSLGAALLGAASVALPGSGDCCPESGTPASPCASLSPTTCCEPRAAIARVQSSDALFTAGSAAEPSRLSERLAPSLIAEPPFPLPQQRALSSIVLRL